MLQSGIPSTPSGVPSMTTGFPWLSFLPPDSSHPLCPFPDIISLTDTLNGIPMPRQFLIARHPMDEAVACSTQPGYTVQHMLFVPAALQNFSMNAPGYEVVVCKWYIVPLTDFAGACPSRDPLRRSRCHRRHI